MIRRLVPYLLLIAAAAPAFAQNPILNPPARQEGGQEDASRLITADPLGRSGIGFSALIRRWSNSLQRRIAELSREVYDDGNIGAALLAFLAALLFGIVHIAGPGHGKVFALSYFSAREARPVDGFAYSALVNLIDSLSALLVVSLGYLLLSTIAPAFQTSAPRVLQIVSYSLIVIFGVGHLVGHLFHRGHDHSGGHGHSVEHDHSVHGAATTALGEPSVTTDRGSAPVKPWMLAVTVGLVPCPVSTILLVYGVVNDVLGLMILMVVGVSVGGFLTMSGITLAVIAGRRGVMSKLSSGAIARATVALEFVSSGLIVGFGLLLLLSQLL